VGDVSGCDSNVAKRRFALDVVPTMKLRSLTLVSLLATGAAHADPGVRVAPSIVGGIESFHYAEEAPANGGVVDKHDATLPTVTFAIDASALHGHLFGRGLFTATDGSMTYVGSTQNGAPAGGPTEGSMTNVEAIVGGRGWIWPRVELGGFIGLGHRTWNRDLTPVSAGGYDEQYAWSYVPIGVEVNVPVSPRLTFVATAQVMSPTGHGNLHVSRSQIFDDTDLTLVPDDGVRVQLAASYVLRAGWSAVALLGYERDQIDAGPPTIAMHGGMPITDGMGNTLYLHEPYSSTSRYTMNVGVAYAF
jgi:hypothetical protein